MAKPPMFVALELAIACCVLCSSPLLIWIAQALGNFALASANLEHAKGEPTKDPFTGRSQINASKWGHTVMSKSGGADEVVTGRLRFI